MHRALLLVSPIFLVSPIVVACSSAVGPSGQPTGQGRTIDGGDAVGIGSPEALGADLQDTGAVHRTEGDGQAGGPDRARTSSGGLDGRSVGAHDAAVDALADTLVDLTSGDGAMGTAGDTLSEKGVAVGDEATNPGTPDGALDSVSLDSVSLDNLSLDNLSLDSASDTAVDAPATATQSGDPRLVPEPFKPGLNLSAPCSCTVGSTIPGDFNDMAAQWGIAFVGPEKYPASSAYAGHPVREGGGVGVADFNGDQYPDLYVASETGPDVLYLSTPGGAKKFAAHPIKVSGEGAAGAYPADLDNDGDPDMVIGAMGFRVLRFDGGTSFSDVTKQLGLLHPGEPLYSLAIADIDGDGLLDLLAAGNMLEKAPNQAKPAWYTGFPPMGFDDLLFRATGKWAYKEVTSTLPQSAIYKEGIAYGANFVDYDGDGDQDIYIANDFGSFYRPNELFRNDGVAGGQVKWTNVSVQTSVDLAMSSMGSTWADFDDDGDLDLYVCGFASQNSLLRNDGKKGFMNVTKKTNTSANTPGGTVSWGAVWLDFDNDGLLDLYVSHGLLHLGFADGEGEGGFGPPGSSGSDSSGGGSSGGGSSGGGSSGGGSSGGGSSGGGSSSGGGNSSGGGFGGGLSPAEGNPVKQPDVLLRRIPDGYYEDVTWKSLAPNLKPTRATAVADLDRDGFPELIVNSTSGPLRVYHNGCNGSGWLSVRLAGTKSNRDGIGARVVATVGSHTMTRDIAVGRGLWTGNEKVAHFGLGSAQKVDELKVYWPSGKVQTFKNVPARRHAVVVEQ